LQQVVEKTGKREMIVCIWVLALESLHKWYTSVPLKPREMVDRGRLRSSGWW